MVIRIRIPGNQGKYGKICLIVFEPTETLETA